MIPQHTRHPKTETEYPNRCWQHSKDEFDLSMVWSDVDMKGARLEIKHIVSEISQCSAGRIWDSALKRYPINVELCTSKKRLWSLVTAAFISPRASRPRLASLTLCIVSPHLLAIDSESLLFPQQRSEANLRRSDNAACPEGTFFLCFPLFFKLPWQFSLQNIESVTAQGGFSRNHRMSQIGRAHV